MKENIIETIDLTKIYPLKGRKRYIKALDKVNLNVKEREKFGLLGPNGAGKTTLVSILTTLIQPTSGSASIDGINILKYPQKVKNKIGLILGSDMIYYRMTGYANLKFFCKIYEIKDYKKKILEAAREFELENWLNEYVEKYSTGMKIKLSLCRIFLTNPKILFLDEPTLGLDVKTTNYIIEKLKRLNQTIFITSHNMNVIEKLCDRVAFIEKGCIKKVGNKKDLQNLIQNEIKIYIEPFKNHKELKLELSKQEYITKIEENKKGLFIYLKEKENYKDLFSVLQHHSISKFQEIDMNIEELFLKIID